MNIFEERPFKVRNAEEFEMGTVLDVFVNPLATTRNPFEFENNIVKGGMGSGKSMLLRANYAFTLYSIVPSLIAKESVILPILIKLSDFQHIREPHEIYRAIVIKIIKEIAKVYSQLENAETLSKIHQSMSSLPNTIFSSIRHGSILKDLVKMESIQYKETVSKELGLGARIKSTFMELGTAYKGTLATEIINKSQPGISDIHDSFEYLLGGFNGALLLLIDEAGSLNKSFFKDGTETSLFETLMNQLRTAEYLRTKIAIYPHSYSDILVETRYGDQIHLTENITDLIGYERFRKRAIEIIDRYIQSVSQDQSNLTDVFNIENLHNAVGDSLEQIIYASGGNIRRLLLILDLCMQEAYCEHSGEQKVEYNHVLMGLKRHSDTAESIYTALDRDFLETLSKVCRSRSTYRFKFPYKAPVLSKYLSRSEEQNILAISEAGSGRRGTTYEFDYAFCVHHDIPTHYITGTERIDKSRSIKNGEWISRVAQISEQIVEHANIPGKIEGVIEFVTNGNGFVKGDDGKEYFLHKISIIEADQSKPLIEGKRIRFYPVINEGSGTAYAVEIL